MVQTLGLLAFFPALVYCGGNWIAHSPSEEEWTKGLSRRVHLLNPTCCQENLPSGARCSIKKCRTPAWPSCHASRSSGGSRKNTKLFLTHRECGVNAARSEQLDGAEAFLTWMDKNRGEVALLPFTPWWQQQDTGCCLFEEHGRCSLTQGEQFLAVKDSWGFMKAPPLYDKVSLEKHSRALFFDSDSTFTYLLWGSSCDFI